MRYKFWASEARCNFFIISNLDSCTDILNNKMLTFFFLFIKKTLSYICLYNHAAWSNSSSYAIWLMVYLFYHIADFCLPLPSFRTLAGSPYFTYLDFLGLFGKHIWYISKKSITHNLLWLNFIFCCSQVHRVWIS